MATRKRKQDNSNAPAVASRAAAIFGTPASLFSGRAKVTTLGLQRGVSEMIRRVYATVPGVAPMDTKQPQIKLTYVGEQACARYTWARDKARRLSVAGVINLPATGEHDALIPRRIADQYTGYALHEMAHFLFTPLTAFDHAIRAAAMRHGVSEAFAKSIINGLEDVAIERDLIRSGYAPGAGAMLRGLLEKCIADVPRDAYGTLRAFPVTLCFGLRGYTPAAQPMIDALPAQLRAIYDNAAASMSALAQRAIGDTDAMNGLIRVANEVLAALAALREQQPKGDAGDAPQPSEDAGDAPQPSEDKGDAPQPSEDAGDGDADDGDADDGDADDGDADDGDADDGDADDGDADDGDADDGDPMGAPDDGKGDTGDAPDPLPAQPDDVTPDAPAPAEDTDAGDAPDDEAGKHEPSKDAGSDEPPASLDTDALNGTPISGDMQPDQAGEPGMGASGLENDAIRVITAPDASPNDYYHSNMADSVTQALSTSARIAHGLRTLLDTSARDSREGGRKNGRLDTSAFARIATGAETVFEKRAYRDGTDAAVSILIDRSSSMNSYGRIQAARTLAGALSKIITGCAGVRSEILGFHSGNGGGASTVGNMAEGIVSDLGSQEDQDLLRSLRGNCTITIYKGFHESHARAMARLGSCYGSGGTPDAASIIHAAQRLQKEQAGLRVLIVIADGEGSDDTVLARIVKRLEREGIVLIAIGIEQDMNGAFTNRARVDDVRKLNEGGLGALLAVLARGETAQIIKGGGDD